MNIQEIDSAIIVAIRDEFDSLKAAELMMERMDSLIAGLMERIRVLEAECSRRHGTRFPQRIENPSDDA